MKPRRGIGLTHCPNFGARIVPTPRELKQWRKTANLSQGKIAALLKITAAHVAYLEHGCQGRPESTSVAAGKIHQFEGWREWWFGFWQGEREGDLRLAIALNI